MCLSIGAFSALLVCHERFKFVAQRGQLLTNGTGPGVFLVEFKLRVEPLDGALQGDEVRSWEMYLCTKSTESFDNLFIIAEAGSHGRKQHRFKRAIVADRTNAINGEQAEP